MPQITSITIDQSTVTHSYKIGEIDLSTINIFINKDDGTSESLSLSQDMLNAEDLARLLIVGTHELTVTYLDHSVTLSITIVEDIPIMDYIRISFVSNGGTSINQMTVKEGGSISQYPIPTKTGHEFKGWFLDSALTQSVNSLTVYNADQTLYAK